MTDIARIGIQVDTGGVEKGVSALNKLQQAAAGVTTANLRMQGTVQAANAEIASSAVAAAQAQLMTSEATLKRVRNQQSATKADKDAAKAARDAAKETLKQAMAEEQKAQALLKAASAQKASTAANRVAFAAGARISTSGAAPSRPTLAVNNGPTLPRDMAPNRFNTANIAAQFQDIGVTAAMGMNPLIIAMQQGTQIAAIMNSMASPLAGLKAAFVQVLNPISLMSIALVGVVAAGLQMVDWVSLAQSALNGLADVVEAGAPYFGILAAAMALIYAPQILSGIAVATTSIIGLGASALKAGASMVFAWAAAATPLTILIGLVAVVSAAVVAFKDDLKGLLGYDVLEPIKAGINKVIGFFLGLFEGVWAAAQNLIGKLKGDEGLPSMVTAFNTAIEGAMNRDYVGMAGNAASAAAEAIRNAAKGIVEEEEKKKKGGKTDAEKYQDVINGAYRRIESLKAEQAAIGMTEEAASRLRHETDLLNDANQKGITLSEMQKSAIGELASEMARIETSIKRQKEMMDFAKDSAKGFFGEMVDGLREGRGLWQSFGDAVSSALDKIFNKILNSGIDQLYDSLFPSGSGGIGGGSGILADLGNFLFSAKGNAFNSGGVQEFAKGGAFTNTVVNRTTPFAFAGGGAFGVMGEAGPEAVMPLHRGPDGSLGVKLADGAKGGGTAVIININNNSNASVSTQQRQTTGGLEIDVMVDEMVSQKIAEQGSSTNRSLNARDSRRLISR